MSDRLNPWVQCRQFHRLPAAEAPLDRAYDVLAVILYVAGDMVWGGALEIEVHAFTS